jgi:hypothetical protein
MPDQPTRRALLSAVGAAAAAHALPAKATPAEPDTLLAQLSGPLPEEAAKLLPGMRDGIRQAGVARSRYPLPDASEPCFVFVPTAVKLR